MSARLRLGVVLGAIGLAACNPSGHGDYTTQTKDLEIVSWWTSGSERKALDVLFDRFRKADPGVTIESAAIQGGAGSNVQLVLAKRLLADDPPDVWQTFPGASLRANAQSGRIADVGAVLDATGLASAMPPSILAALTWDGKRWGVPVGAHRQNMLWFDPAVLKQAGVAPPTAGTTTAQLATDLDMLRANQALTARGVAPLCLGGKDRFTTTELFEDLLLARIGAKGWSDIATDTFDWNGAAVRGALGDLARMLDATAPGAQPQPTWDEAAQRLAQGKCGFLVMNDSLYGELVADGVAPAAIGSTPFPGTDGAFLAIVDTFVAAREAKDGANALRFLSTIAAAETELAFAAVKGTAPLRRDIDVASLPAYQRSAFEAMSHGTILLSITHGELLSPQLQQAIYDGIAAFAASRDAKSFTDRFQRVVAADVPTGH